MAIETYREGLAELPSTRAPDPPPSLKGKEKAVEADAGSGATSGHGVTEDERAELDECRELRAMLSANVAACHLKLVSRNLETFESIAGCEKSADLDRNAQQRWKEAVSACDEGASRGEAPGILEAPVLIHVPGSNSPRESAGLREGPSPTSDRERSHRKLEQPPVCPGRCVPPLHQHSVTSKQS